MTPHELNLYIHARNERLRRDDESRALQAYLIAAWHPMRTRRLPPWAEISKREQPVKEQSDEEMLRQAKTLNSIFGGAVS